MPRGRQSVSSFVKIPDSRLAVYLSRALGFGMLMKKQSSSPVRTTANPLQAVAAVLLMMAGSGKLLAIDSDLHGSTPSLLASLPFVLLLMGIGLFPLLIPHLWHRDSLKAVFALALALPVALTAPWHGILHALLEYLAFMTLIGSLFIVSGNIHLEGTWPGTPRANTALLGLGAVLANFLGTTGASMLLVRVLLGTNRGRQHQVHLVVFFIFIVSNTAGLLTPLGDPPLFLGFLHGVPFHWTLGLAPQWLLVNGLLLALFWLCDSRFFADRVHGDPETAEKSASHRLSPTLFVQGGHNVLFLLGIIGAVLLKGVMGESVGALVLSSGIMALMAWLALRTTPAALRALNGFSWAPVLEVGILFAGLFVTMGPAIALLEHNSESLGVTKPWQFFWYTGLLSSFLDNAPTYVAFGSLALGGSGLGPDADFGNLTQLDQGILLAAISCGAVFMGAMTYIGNGPNFMVKSIAEASGIRMPGFFGYLLWSCGLLLPVLVICCWLFFI